MKNDMEFKLGPMTVLVCGSRDWQDRKLIYKALDAIQPKPAAIIQGGCRGVDSIANRWCGMHGVTSVAVMAEWQKYGRAAGPIRNQKMVDMRPHFVVAFLTKPLGQSIGTSDTVTRARKANIPIIFVKAFEEADAQMEIEQ